MFGSKSCKSLVTANLVNSQIIQRGVRNFTALPCSNSQHESQNESKNHAFQHLSVYPNTTFKEWYTSMQETIRFLFLSTAESLVQFGRHFCVSGHRQPSFFHHGYVEIAH